MQTPFVLLQYILPHHLISRVVLRATRIRYAPIKNALITAFMNGFRPDLSDAENTDPLSYASFNAFFTRALQPGTRPLAPGVDTIVSPVDGTLSQSGAITDGAIIQAKSHRYTLDALLAGGADAWSPRFEHGTFATIYLAPYNYHRIHMPVGGTLKEAWYVPGRLFSVNAATASQVPGLFARNERVVLLFEGETGPFAVVLVGALNVGSMDTVWHGNVTPRRPRRICRLPMNSDIPFSLEKGAELGRFNMGSTVVLLFGEDIAAIDAGLAPGTTLRLGQAIGRLLRKVQPA
jgi:phosphatidylserine decarboxylase